MQYQYARFLPLKERLKLTDQILSRHKKKKNSSRVIKLNQLNFLISRYSIIYQIDFDTIEQKFQDESFSGDRVNLFEKKELVNYTVLQKGIPILTDVVTRLCTESNYQFSFFDFDISLFLYILSKDTPLTPELNFFALTKREYNIYLRTAEDGSMIRMNHKTHENKDKPPEMIVHYPSIDRDVIITEDSDLSLVSSFYSKIDQFITDFFMRINKKSIDNIQLSSLSEIILKTNLYRKIHIERTLAGNHVSSKIRELLKKPRNPRHDRTDAVHHACQVSGCLLFENVTPDMQVYSLYCHKNVFLPNGEKTTIKDYDKTFKLCFEHGRLIISLWYLLNHIKIWSGIFTDSVVTDIRKATSRNYPLFVYFQKIVEKINLITAEREKIELSMLYIENWSKRHLSD